MMIRAGLASPEEVEESLAEQERLKGAGVQRRLGEIMVERGIVESGDLARLLSRQREKLRVDVGEAPGGVAILELFGALDDENTRAVLDGALAGLLGRGRFEIVVDCSGLNYMNSLGVGVFVERAGELRREGGDFHFCRLPARGADVFGILELDRVFRVFGGRAEAVAAFARRAGASERPEAVLAASRLGRTYHRPECLAVRAIAAYNYVEFHSFREAEGSGRRPCAKCRPRES